MATSDGRVVEDTLMFVGLLLVANHRSGPNAASQVFADYALPSSRYEARSPHDGLDLANVVIKPTREAFVQSERGSGKAPTADAQPGWLYSDGWGELCCFTEDELVAHVLAPLQVGCSESLVTASLKVGMLLHEDYVSEEQHDMKILRGVDPEWQPRVCSLGGDSDVHDQGAADTDVDEDADDMDDFAAVLRDGAGDEFDGSTGADEGPSSHHGWDAVDDVEALFGYAADDDDVGEIDAVIEDDAAPVIEDGAAPVDDGDDVPLETELTINGLLAEYGFEERPTKRDHLWRIGSSDDSPAVGRLQIIQGSSLSMKVYCLCDGHNDAHPVHGGKYAGQCFVLVSAMDTFWPKLRDMLDWLRNAPARTRDEHRVDATLIRDRYKRSHG